MATTMNISGYEIEREDAPDDFNDAELRAEWDARLQIAELPAATEDRHTAFPPELVNVDIEAFLKKMYEYRR